SHPFDHVAHTTSQTRLAKRKLPPMGVTREIAFIAEVMLLHKPATFTLLAEPGIFQSHEYGDGIAVVRLDEVHVFRRHACHFECCFGRRLDQRGRETARARNAAMPTGLASA